MVLTATHFVVQKIRAVPIIPVIPVVRKSACQDGRMLWQTVLKTMAIIPQVAWASASMEDSVWVPFVAANLVRML